MKKAETTFEDLPNPTFGLDHENVRREIGKDPTFLLMLNRLKIRKRAIRNGTPEGPVLSTLRAQYDALPEDHRMICGEVKTWDEVLDAIPNMELFLTEIDTFMIPQVFCIDCEKLFVGEGAQKTDYATREKTFFEAREMATRTGYKNDEGEVVIIKGTQEKPPPEAEMLLRRGLFDETEYRFVAPSLASFIDANGGTWLENGSHDPSLRYAKAAQSGEIFQTEASRRDYHLGIRPVARFYLSC